MVRETNPVAIGTTVVDLICEGHFAELEKLFAPRLSAVVSADTVRSGWAVALAGTGPVTSAGQPVTSPGPQEGLVLVVVPVTCQRGRLAVHLTVDGGGLLHGLRLAPPETTPWAPPPYAAVKRFTEQEISLGSGPLTVPGTLTSPRGRTHRPGVVLLSGGGPFDRDETHGANKPLKDLAWGLASRGVAVLRFDKVTFTHATASEDPKFTMTDEYVPHATAAVRLLQQQPGVDPARVFVLGHSMGGKVAPRVAAAAPSVAGLVLLAADAQPMQHAAVRVVRYLARLDPGPDADAAVTAAARQAAVVDGPGLTAATPASDLPFGYPAAYWLDQRRYDPVQAAAALDKPMLILQGGRDYQVTVDDDLARWRTGLTNRPDVTIRVYDADNHLFFPGTNLSTPADYDPPQHVDQVVIDDIARWLAPRHGFLARLRSGRSQRRLPAALPRRPEMPGISREYVRISIALARNGVGKTTTLGFWSIGLDGCRRSDNWRRFMPGTFTKRKVVAALAVTTLLAVACESGGPGGGTGNAPPSASAAAAGTSHGDSAPCHDVAALRTSVSAQRLFNATKARCPQP